MPDWTARPSRACERVVLSGFMGSGKTTVGRLLALQLGWTFVDLDTAVEERLGLAVPQIFQQQGEPAFRAAESECLQQQLLLPQRVLALGGGAPTTATVRSVLQAAPATLVIYLQAAFELLYERCRQQAQDRRATARPLLGERGAALARFQEREPLYAAVAHHKVDASGAPSAVAEAISLLLRTSALSVGGVVR